MTPEDRERRFRLGHYARDQFGNRLNLAGRLLCPRCLGLRGCTCMIGTEGFVAQVRGVK